MNPEKVALADLIEQVLVGQADLLRAVRVEREDTGADHVHARELQQGRVLVECDLEVGAKEVIEMSMPCVIGCGKGLNKPSYPTLPAIIKARKKEVQQIDLQSLNIEKPAGRIEILELKHAVEERRPKKINGTTEEIAGELLRILQEEAKIIDEQ